MTTPVGFRCEDGVTMNLYAISCAYEPGNEVTLVLATDDAEAIQEGVYRAAKDVANGNYFSPSADVYLVATDLRKVGTAHATDAPREWEWAHPAVAENVATAVLQEAALNFERGDSAS
jgi:hypothetical protein